jgi:trehalose synthase-fused probable maltokinase
MVAADAALARAAAGFDAGWLAARRWFRAKARGIEAVTPEEAVRLGSGGPLLVVLRAALADGGEQRYLVPAVPDVDGDLREPRDGEGAWAALLAAMADGETADAATGSFAFVAAGALSELLPGGAAEARGLDERRLEVEQSNTSVRLGDRLILKIYRLLEAGTNPEVEMNAFLADVGFRWVPRLAGHATWRPREGAAAAAAMLQELVPARGDAWSWLLASLGSPPQGPLEALAGVAQIGGITAELHAALASRPELPDFPARAATADELRAWRAGAQRQLDAAISSVEGDERSRLEAVADPIRARFAAIEEAAGPELSRVHGDYHLGQLLRTEEGFMVIDFEGEPSRPMAERRLPASPLRDVAGMLRSLDYAARTAERDGSPGLAHEEWLANARSTFLAAYGGEALANGELLAALEAEKACYEVRYEANYRPGWTWLPIEALERLAA